MEYANHIAYSDINPFEIVRKVSDKTMEVREMDAERDESVKMDFIPGGFSAVCTNMHSQKWHIKSQPDNPIVRIRMHKSGVWKDKHGRRFSPSEQPCKFYDYNF